MYSVSKPLMKVVSVILCISLVLGCAGAFAAGKDPNKVTDNLAPDLTNFVFTENGATLQAGSKIHLSVQAEDRSKINHVNVEFDQYDYNSEFNVRLEYNAASDRYEGEYTLTDGLANGTWFVYNVYAVDEYDNSYSMGGTDYGTFILVGNQEASTENLFAAINLVENGQTVRPGDTIHVAVKLTGEANDVDPGLARLTDDGYALIEWVYTRYNSENGWWEGEFTFTEDMMNGVYYFPFEEYITEGSSRWIRTNEEDYGTGRLQVIFTGGVDTIDEDGPNIAGFTLAENGATMTTGGILHFTATITDPAGVDRAYVYIEGPYSSTRDPENWKKSHSSTSIGGGFGIELQHQTGDVWAANFELPQDLVNTTYSITSISAYDKFNNENWTGYDQGQVFFNFSGEDIVNNNIADFVKRCYNIILGRGVDETGLQGWGIALATGQSTAAQIINSLTESDEFKQKGLSKGEIVDRMYLAMLGREADPAGKQAWVDVLNQGYPVASIVNGFSGSVEFRGICKSYGIRPGTVDGGQPSQPVQPAGDMNKIKAFVSRCYSVILGRGADPDGLNGWANALASGQAQASQIIDGFVNSQEFLNKGLSREEQVDTLYQAMLGRAADPTGKAAWVQVLNEGHPFAAVINGFCGSTEFINLCAEYGIQPGSVQVKAAIMKRVSITPEGSDPSAPVVRVGYESEYTNQEKVRAFVEHCYLSVLGREGDEDGILNYTALILGGKKTPKQVAYEFVFSPEFQGKLPGNEAFIRILYKLYLNREPNAEELGGWVAMLEGGTSLEEIVKGFADGAEFRAIVREMKE